MKSRLISFLLIVALAVPPLSPAMGQARLQSERSQQIAVRIAQLSPSTLEAIRRGQSSPIIPVRRGGGLVAGLIIGAVVASAISRSARKRRYKRHRRRRKYRRYW
ncbi:MAG: hypothetical protein ABUJ98_13105 [Hyphomicrobium sp.]|jgi:hypothetical protein